ncbi:MAG: hypothetical protein H6832_03465 [Planctomycetes bacterium]|nr:hypothetical protein [Planctomycetota bacterium]
MNQFTKPLLVAAIAIAASTLATRATDAQFVIIRKSPGDVSVASKGVSSSKDFGHHNAGGSIRGSLSAESRSLYLWGLGYEPVQRSARADAGFSATLFGRSAEVFGTYLSASVRDGTWTETMIDGRRVGSDYRPGSYAGYAFGFRVAGRNLPVGSGSGSLRLYKNASYPLFAAGWGDSIYGIGVTANVGVYASGGYDAGVTLTARSTGLFGSTAPIVNGALRTWGSADGKASLSVNAFVAAAGIDHDIRLGMSDIDFDMTASMGVRGSVSAGVTPLVVNAQGWLRIGAGWFSKTVRETLFSWSSPRFGVNASF